MQIAQKEQYYIVLTKHQCQVKLVLEMRCIQKVLKNRK